MENAVIIGRGTVGEATALAFSINKFFDIDANKSNITLEEAHQCRYVFVCLPTPTIEKKCFTNDIFKIVSQIRSYNKFENIFIIRSTVYPGFADYLMEGLGINSVVSNPEFLSEKTWQQDAIHPQLVVIGGRVRKYLDAVEGIYRARYSRIKPVLTNNTTAEIVKYAMNCWFSTKVVFSNEMFDIAQKLKGNYEVIKEVMELHPWGMKNHNTIWYNEQRGLHGKCLPKDLEAFADLTQSKFFKTLEELNATYQ